MGGEGTKHVGVTSAGFQEGLSPGIYSESLGACWDSEPQIRGERDSSRRKSPGSPGPISSFHALFNCDSINTFHDREALGPTLSLLRWPQGSTIPFPSCPPPPHHL